MTKYTEEQFWTILGSYRSRVHNLKRRYFKQNLNYFYPAEGVQNAYKEWNNLFLVGHFALEDAPSVYLRLYMYSDHMEPVNILMLRRVKRI